MADNYVRGESMITCFKLMERSQCLAIGLHQDIGGGLVTLKIES